MKICVTAGAAGLDAPVDPRFGRCPFFVVVDLDSMSESSMQNTAAGAAGGAGIQAAQLVSQLGASVLITGNVGPNAMQVLSSAGIEIYQSQGGTVRDAVERFRRGELAKVSGPTAPPHGGMGRGMGPGGMGGGMGAGRGRRW
ncbi:MAG: NifB/NifX family molybdenum-iron cluster-binding protein [Methanothrix sp.]|jgi:predicted Fe-Mo cluster-binding NifX family protein|uniref:Dinitrogenase iron-molybdenum cofactor biosynthesis n=1 Tax=Methanothrix thermoacetophila (strain DSM 6194 / JCM 14653 / NBRC 101360 / PT) TaxID=349307 RepID=A0B6M7_METTP|nr:MULTISPECIES: NifB/NifX family molybdenum-iron cluster-binding protein [Methanothrix]ABK14351.1 Dinitrogenase iron-molybdenum cofactor biosynthesis [Methanothrix thermoacetophila PT]MBC7080344.1 NifB/NifX family molybdenum-iron cluster-binding protein [Methanothrix sp.]NPU87623.1 NifB/NifX family molybdenum-iron cluster-binding protein [Methanothrix sp.]